ncbi:hypothetical protein CP532_1696 [Ophiocordyceps camponoti-leonardi (nom. inval.)]|nr:hypothetical protein CP532_1696 [Ophiocordyceps camponoti-leonardi (nom. inval.)]
MLVPPTPGIPVHLDTPSPNRPNVVTADDQEAQSHPDGATVGEESPDMSATATITRSRRDARQASTTLVAAAPAIRPAKRTSSGADLRDESATKRSSPRVPDDNTSSQGLGDVSGRMVSLPKEEYDRIMRLIAPTQSPQKPAEEDAAAELQGIPDTTGPDAKLSLKNHLTSAHDLVYKTFESKIVWPPADITTNTTNNSTTTTRMTDVTGKWCPTDLRPWEDFSQCQERTFEGLFAVWDEHQPAFHGKNILTANAEATGNRDIREENDVRNFLESRIEEPVLEIVKKLQEDEKVRGRFNIQNGIAFQCHGRDMRQVEDSDGKDDPIIHVSEFKKPQILTKDVIKRGLHRMNIFKEVARRKPLGRVRVDQETKLNFAAKRLVGGAITQTFHYIIENGLNYGLLTTGEAMIFLKVNWNEPPGRVYYHLAYPGQDVENAPEGTSHQLTAVGQYLAFTLMASDSLKRSRQLDQTTKKRFKRGLRQWGPSPTPAPKSSPPYDRNADDGGDSGDSGDDDDGSGPGGPAQGTRSKRSAQGTGQQTQGGSSKNNTRQTQGGSSKNNTQQTGGRDRGNHAMFDSLGGPGSEFRGLHEGDIPYCTQRCLAGIACGAPLDEKCPNVALHRGNTKRTHHRLNQTQFLDHLSKQLDWSLDRGVTPLGVNGACGFTFKVTLLLYGYTMISKGTVQHLARYLVRETAVYERLRPIQGKHIPVCLGSVDLQTIDTAYNYPFGYNITYMIFLAWGGTAANRIGLDDKGINAIEEKAEKALDACHDLGVIHEDVRLANMVVSEDGDKVMMIDFERAKIVKPRRKALVEKTNRLQVQSLQRSQPSGSGPSSTVKSPSSKVKKSPSPTSQKRAWNVEPKPRQEMGRKTLVDKTNRQPRAQRTQRSASGPPSTRKIPSPTSKKLVSNAKMEPQREPGRKVLLDKTNRQGRMQPSQSSGAGTSLTTKKRTRDTETELNQAARAKRARVREETCWEEPRWQLRGRTVLVKTDRQPRAQTSGSGPSLMSKKRSRDAGAETEPRQAVRAKKIHLRHDSWAFSNETEKSEWSMKTASRMVTV